MSLTPSQFVERWRVASLSERSGAQSHFIDLCNMLDHLHPAAADGVGERFTFEKSVSKVYGGYGFADVWLRDHFAWEYKESRSKKHKDLKAAYKQLNDYREDLGNPPLLVVCDLDRFEVHTNFTSTHKRVYSFNLHDLNLNQVTPTCPLPPLDVLRALFGDYSVLRPDRTDARVTQEVALHFTRLAERLELEERNISATKEQIAHFLMRLLFCLFADSVGLLPNHLFRNLLVSDERFSVKKFLRKLSILFKAMAEKDGIFGEYSIKHFNGGLFDSDSVIALDAGDIGILHRVAANYDWSHIAPAIFGTLFERSLDPARRSLIGAHYTSEDDILLIIEPVILRPLRQRWEHVRESVLEALISEQHRRDKKAAARLFKTHPEAERFLAEFFDLLAAIRVLDPACGSGNFLYVALHRILDLWKEARDFAIENHIQVAIKYALEKMPSPTQLYGIETEFYAHELASIVVWIGFLQWKHEHGITEDREPILQKLDNIEHADAILRYDSKGKAYEPRWPKANFIIGNPPFLGSRRLRGELGDRYVDDMFAVYGGKVPKEVDLVTYWFAKAMEEVGINHSRVGMLATQAIRAGANRTVLQRILQSGGIFFAWSNRAWTLDGASIRVSMLGFDDGTEQRRQLDGEVVPSINSDLSSGNDLTASLPLPENEGISFQGPVKVGRFELEPETARKMLAARVNPNGRSNSEVVIPWIIAKDLTGRPKGMYIIDFRSRTETESALYELPFECVKRHVYPARQKNKRARRRENWWHHGEKNLGMHKALAGLHNYIASPRVSKHRFFQFVPAQTLADSRVVVIAREDLYFFGILESALHRDWSVASSSRHGVGNDITYNIESCFDTFPFPWPPGTEPSEAENFRVYAIAEAARELIRLRNTWLNPPGASKEELKLRTLTNLYNAQPAWLTDAHQSLDRAVFDAYGLAYPLTRNEILSHLLALNSERAAGHVRAVSTDLPPKKAPGAERPVRQKSLTGTR